MIGDRAKAETIASRTARHISERMGEDPVFYKKLSELIAQTIADLRAQRISEAEALKKIKAYREQAVTKGGEDVPPILKDKGEAIAFFRLAGEVGRLPQEQATQFAQAADGIIRQYLVVDWQSKLDVVRKMNFYIGEYAIDELGMAIREAEDLADKCIDVAKTGYKV